ncbi:DinB family protein [Roseiconus nitratireducens]|nr:DinB family protein [Roseiconus nitratireducens]
MSDYEMLDDLYAYNEWANSKVLSLCEGLTASQLDQEMPIGRGSLRATLFHILAAEDVWMDRWTGIPWRPFPTDPESIRLDEIQDGLDEVAAQRRSLIELNRPARWSETITYQDSKKNEHTHSLYDLLLHVANHGVHHRAQALHFLKKFGRTVPAGLDYIFYRLAASTVDQDPAAVKQLQQFGLSVGTIKSRDPQYDAALVQRLYAYHDWAMNEVFDMCDTVDVAALDQDFSMGSGTIRKCLRHLLDAEQWWIDNWSGDSNDFPRSAEEMPLQEIQSQWKKLSRKRKRFLATVDEDAAMKVVTVAPNGLPTSFRIGESVLQLPLHGTHHRAQIINMVRRSKGRLHNIDLLYAIDELK